MVWATVSDRETQAHSEIRWLGNVSGQIHAPLLGTWRRPPKLVHRRLDWLVPRRGWEPGTPSDWPGEAVFILLLASRSWKGVPFQNIYLPCLPLRLLQPSAASGVVTVLIFLVNERSGSKQSTNPADNYHLARRRTLQVVVSSLLTEAGFESAEKASVETLTEMLQSYISEIGRSAKSYCEHTARTQPTLSDIVVTLVEMGFNVDTLPAYAKRSQRMVITAPPVTNQPVAPKALTAGQNRPHPPHIPSHFPEFPDPHTYIKTPDPGQFLAPVLNS
ncbi:transcription initiation factor TFIID subunit 8 isoform X4 [Peromyscus maniculatus bairdii]|uniref:transcription initiation factor TFIID subunit 8 isoform X4 n=1 Tax=Peromyscus maniculatus bairdii TaxID=230844 RepID=UPI003FD39B48